MWPLAAPALRTTTTTTTSVSRRVKKQTQGVSLKIGYLIGIVSSTYATIYGIQDNTNYCIDNVQYQLSHGILKFVALSSIFFSRWQ